MQREWKTREFDENEVLRLSSELKVSKILSAILVNRGIKNKEDAKIFIDAKLRNLRSPFLLKTLKIAVERVIEAIKRNEKIVIYGDYDVDGITSSALLINFFENIGYSVEYFIPDRFRDGYGLNKERLKEIIQRKRNLIISVDCGTTNIEEAKLLKENEVDLIVIDHHCPSDELPPCVALINPLQKGCEFPFKEMASVGLTFYFLIGLKSTLKEKGILREDELPDLREYLDIVCIGTIGDIVPLLYENRIFAKYGLLQLEKTKNYGLQSILQVGGIKERKLTSNTVSFMIAPRFNAGGRLSSAEAGVRLITTKSPSEAMKIAAEIDLENRKRQNIENEILEEAIQIVERENLNQKYKILVLSKEGWHQGVVGIVASKLCERYNKPSVVIAIEGDRGIGSCRSINGFNIVESLYKCEEYLIKYGGHFFAAGLTIKKQNIPPFTEKLNKYANEVLGEEYLIPYFYADMKINLEEISFNLMEELSMLEPFGYKNPEPYFILEDVKVLESTPVGNDKRHLRMLIEKGGVRHWTIHFDFGSKIPSSKSVIDILFTPKIDLWQDEVKIKLYIKDFKLKNGDLININE